MVSTALRSWVLARANYLQENLQEKCPPFLEFPGRAAGGAGAWMKLIETPKGVPLILLIDLHMKFSGLLG